MKRFMKFLISSIIIVTVAFGIFKITNKYSLSVLDKSIEWAISLKGYEGARCFDYDDNGNLYIAFSDVIRVINKEGKDEVIIRESSFDILDILCYKEKLLLATDNRVVEYDLKNNDFKEIISNIPNTGENRKVNLFVKDEKIYVSIGSNTNSGISSKIGEPKDVATTTWRLSGENYGEHQTGAFSDFGIETKKDQEIKGEILGNSAIVEYDLTTDKLKMFSHGLRNVLSWDTDSEGQLFAIIGGMEDKGLRPVKDDKDYIYMVESDTWYGWPDYSGGDPITSPRFTDGEKIEFVIENHIDKTPPAPRYQHKDVGALNGLAIDKENSIFPKDTMIFADNKSKELYTLFSDGVTKTVVEFAEKSYIQDISFNNGEMYILDSGLGCLYKLESKAIGEWFNLPKEIWMFLILFSITILVCIVYKFNKKVKS